jgi:hypothetical protein
MPKKILTQRRKAAKARGKPKGPELNGVHYTSGIRQLTIALCGKLRAAVELVNDRGVWHVGFLLRMPKHSFLRGPRADEVCFHARRVAIIHGCGLLLAAARQAQRETLNLQQRSALDRLTKQIEAVREKFRLAISDEADRQAQRAKRAARPPKPKPQDRRPKAAAAAAPLRETAAAGNGQSAGTALVPLPGQKSFAVLEDGRPAALGQHEQETLHRCEETIRQNLHGFIEVGQALLTIQRERLYRAKYRNFDEYCAAEWDFGKSYAHRLINGATAFRAIEASPIGDKNHRRSDLPEGHIVLPATESQVRPLTKLSDPKQQVAAWRKVLQKAPRGADNVPRVTAEIVEAVVAEVVGEPTRKAEGGRRKAEGNGHAEEARAEPRGREMSCRLPQWKMEEATLADLDRQLEETVKTYSLDELDELLLLLRNLASRVVVLHAKWRQAGAKSERAAQRR